MMTESEESERNWGEYGHEEEEANGGEEEITFARTAEGELLIQVGHKMQQHFPQYFHPLLFFSDQ